MNNLPLRRTTLHLAQRFRIDGDTFITKILLTYYYLTCSQGMDYTRFSHFRPANAKNHRGSRDSQDEGFSFGDGDRMLEMRRQ